MTTTNETIELSDLPNWVGKHLGYSEWREMTQDRVNQFADATDDHQFIHVDVERAKETPVRRHDRPRLSDAVADRPHHG